MVAIRGRLRECPVFVPTCPCRVEPVSGVPQGPTKVRVTTEKPWPKREVEVRDLSANAWMDLEALGKVKFPRTTQFAAAAAIIGCAEIQLLSRSREHTLDAWSDALSAGPRWKEEILLAAVPPGSPLANAMGVLAFIEAEKMAVALLLALGADSTASLAEIGFRRIPMLALPPTAAGPAAAGAPASFPMEGMGRLVDLGSGGRLALERAAQLLRKLHIARPVDDGDRLGWTVAMARASQSITATAAGWLQWSHATPAFCWARALGGGSPSSSMVRRSAIPIRCRSLLPRAEKELFGPWNFLAFCSGWLVLMSVEVNHQHLQKARHWAFLGSAFPS